WQTNCPAPTSPGVADKLPKYCRNTTQQAPAVTRFIPAAWQSANACPGRSDANRVNSWHSALGAGPVNTIVAFPWPEATVQGTSGIGVAVGTGVGVCVGAVRPGNRSSGPGPDCEASGADAAGERLAT